MKKPSFKGNLRHRIDWHIKHCLYKAFGYTFAKLKDQRNYWGDRGKTYFRDFFGSEYYKYEMFFQDLLIEELENLQFESFFEAGCGFGWNVKRIKKEFPSTGIAGLDFSVPQLKNSAGYLPEIIMPGVCADACAMPFKDNAFDIGFSMGVYMNIYPGRVNEAVDEMLRVAGKYVIHIEWDQNNTKPRLKEKRIFKTNIISHNYRQLYEERGKQVLKFISYREMEDRFYKQFPSVYLKTGKRFEGPEKYILLIVKV